MLIHAKAKKAIAKPPEKTSIIRIRITKVCVVAPVVVVGLGQGPYQILYHFSSFGHILYVVPSTNWIAGGSWRRVFSACGGRFPRGRARMMAMLMAVQAL